MLLLRFFYVSSKILLKFLFRKINLLYLEPGYTKYIFIHMIKIRF